jgi:hypothetical protein
MPDECKSKDTVKSYRTYYLKEKINILSYKKRQKPEFIQNNI